MTAHAPGKVALRAVDASQLSVGPIIAAHELLSLQPPVALIEGLFALGHVGALAGEFGTGKTFLALDLARAVALGQAWLGATARAGLVVFIESDSPARSLVPRLLALEARHSGLLTSQRLHFLCEPLTLDVVAQDLLTRIRDLEDHHGEMVRLIIVDSLTVTMPEVGGGALGGIDAARAWIQAARILTEGDQRTVLGLAHVGKDSSRGILGSVALPAAMDVVLSLRSSGDNEWLVTTARERGGKTRDWPACEAKYRLAPERQSAVIETIAEFSGDGAALAQKRRKAPGTAAGLLLAVAKNMAPTVSGRRSAPNRDWPLIDTPVLLESWRTAVRSAKSTARVTPDVFNRMLAGLCETGWLGAEQGGVYVI